MVQNQLETLDGASSTDKMDEFYAKCFGWCHEKWLRRIESEFKLLSLRTWSDEPISMENHRRFRVGVAFSVNCSLIENDIEALDFFAEEDSISDWARFSCLLFRCFSLLLFFFLNFLWKSISRETWTAALIPCLQMEQRIMSQQINDKMFSNSKWTHQEWKTRRK